MEPDEIATLSLTLCLDLAITVPSEEGEWSWVGGVGWVELGGWSWVGGVRWVELGG